MDAADQSSLEHLREQLKQLKIDRIAHPSPELDAQIHALETILGESDAHTSEAARELHQRLDRLKLRRDLFEPYPPPDVVAEIASIEQELAGGTKPLPPIEKSAREPAAAATAQSPSGEPARRTAKPSPWEAIGLTLLIITGLCGGSLCVLVMLGAMFG